MTAATLAPAPDPQVDHRARYARLVANPPMHVVDDVEATFIAGGPDALRLAYEAHGSLVYSYCRRSLGDDRAKDVTQEVFVSAWRARERFDPSRGSLAGWLLGITKNRLIDNVRSERRHTDRQVDREPGDTGADDTGLDRVGDRMLVADALRVLPERPRRVIELAYLDDLTHQEVAEKTGLPLGPVKSDFRRGLARIRHHLESSHE